MFYKNYQQAGSSPRVWGQDTTMYTLINSLRIIPTRMGTSFIIQPAICYCRDHPHAYGDKTCSSTYGKTVLGSSPRVWGQETAEKCLGEGYRIIPTRMGTRSRFAFALWDFRDHPHAYGDKAFALWDFRSALGSSPRVWGQVEA